LQVNVEGRQRSACAFCVSGLGTMNMRERVRLTAKVPLGKRHLRLALRRFRLRIEACQVDAAAGLHVQNLETLFDLLKACFEEAG